MASSATVHRDSAWLSLLIFHLLLSAPAIAQNSSNEIPLGSSIVASEDRKTNSWVSPNGIFAFGFLPANEGGKDFHLAVFFDLPDGKPVAWFAGVSENDEEDVGQLLVGKNSRATLTEGGELVLANEKGQEVWKRPAGGNVSGDCRVASASMLDDGNFVLRTGVGGKLCWSTFDEPRDTLLPTQFLKRSGRLTSRRSYTDFSKGRFELRLQESDGALQLVQVAVPSGNLYGRYWGEGFFGDKLVLDEAGQLKLVQLKSDGSDGATTIISQGEGTAEHFRATIDPDGVLRVYAYECQRSSSSSVCAWSVWWRMPVDICLEILNDVGSGACGFNSYCTLEGEQQTPTCKCPPGYSYLNPNNTLDGCKPEFEAHRCDPSGGLADASRFQMTEITNLDWPLSDYEKYTPINKTVCSEICRTDCFCFVSIFLSDGDGTCWKKKVPLSNGKKDGSVNRLAYIKVAPKAM